MTGLCLSHILLYDDGLIDFIKRDSDFDTAAGLPSRVRGHVPVLGCM